MINADDPRSILKNKRKAGENQAPRVWIVPRIFQKEDAYGNVRVYELDFLQRVFVTFDDAGASELSKFLNITFLIAVVVATVFLVMSTVPSMKERPETCAEPACDHDNEFCPGSMICEPMPPTSFESVQSACAWTFCVDYFTRLFLVGLVPARISGTLPKDWEEDLPEAEMDDDFRERMRLREDPDFPWYIKTYGYFMQTMNLIDLGAIAPFIVEQFNFKIAFGTGFIRMLRLARVFRIFKIGKNNASINLLFLTLSKSLPALMLMGFFLALGVIIFGSTMFICEGGSYTVSEDFPGGKFVRTDLYGRQDNQTPFTSIPIAFYWAVTTSTTVGYGDLYPTTMSGRMVCIVSTFCAMIVLALPISVIGNNFNREYDNIKSGKYDIVVESLVELLNQQTVDIDDVDEEHRDYMLSRKCLAITAIADHMTNNLQAEKVKAALRLRGYEKALDRTRTLAKSRGRRVSLSHSPSMGSVSVLGGMRGVDVSPGGTPLPTTNGMVAARLAGSPEKLRNITALSKKLREALEDLRVKG